MHIYAPHFYGGNGIVAAQVREYGVPFVPKKLKGPHLYVRERDVVK